MRFFALCGRYQALLNLQIFGRHHAHKQPDWSILTVSG